MIFCASIYFIILISWNCRLTDPYIYHPYIFVDCRLTDLKWNRSTGVIEETWERTSTSTTDNLDKQKPKKNNEKYVQKKPSALKSKANKAKPQPKGKGHWAWQRWKKSPLCIWAWQRWKKKTIFVHFVQSSFAPLFAIEFECRAIWIPACKPIYIWYVCCISCVQHFCWALCEIDICCVNFFIMPIAC